MGAYRSVSANATAPACVGPLRQLSSAAAILLLGAGAGSPGCSAECRGPGCESAYPDGRVDLLDDLPLEGQELLIDTLASGSVIGSVVAGSTFSAAPTPNGLVVGQPEAKTVLHLATPTGSVVDDAADTRWVSVDDDFGQDLAVVPHTDGTWTLIVAAPGSDSDRGVVRVYPNAQDGAVDSALTLRGSSQGDRFGTALQLCPDRSGDGLPELLVTAPWMQARADVGLNVPALAGVVLLIDSEDLAASAGAGTVTQVLDVATAWWGDAKGDSLGVGMDCQTDLDGDGRFDIVLGAPTASGSAGRLYVLASSDGFTGGAVGAAARLAVDGQDVEMLGTSVATFLRPEGPQVLVGAPGHEAGRGAAVWFDARDFADANVFRGRVRFESDRTSADHYGRTVAVAELDGDDLPELLVGGPDRREGLLYDVGQLMVFRGVTVWPALTASGSADLAITDDQGFRRVGRRVIVHDIDGDGIDELFLPTRSPRSR